MARKRASRNGRFDEAMTALIQNQATLLQTQAAFVQNQAAFQVQKVETDRRIAEMERINWERFARIESLLLEHSRILAEHSSILTEHSRILADHSRILQALPDVIRDKIGFKMPEQTSPAR